MNSPELTSSISPDYSLHIPPETFSPKDLGHNDTIIVLIPGNPGLISYYHAFLSLLADPATSPTTSRHVIAGFSIGGFEVGTDSPHDSLPKRILCPAGAPEGPLYSLQEQIALTRARIGALVKVLQARLDHRKGMTCQWRVILIGHSVGAYIALEVLRLHKQQQQQQQQSATLFAYSDSTDRSATQAGANFDISAAFLLTPTVVDIALSASGRVAAPLLKYIPGIPLFASLAARWITRLLPETFVAELVRMVMGRNTPAGAVASTISFLRSSYGVRQSLSMAGDEMREIGQDKWGDEVWGVVTARKDAINERVLEDREEGMVGPTALVFYFASRDHWVADQTREAIIRTRGAHEEAGRARIIVAEETELVHGWCIRHNGLVAKKVEAWVDDVVEGKMTTA